MTQAKTDKNENSTNERAIENSKVDAFDLWREFIDAQDNILRASALPLDVDPISFEYGNGIFKVRLNSMSPLNDFIDYINFLFNHKVKIDDLNLCYSVDHEDYATLTQKQHEDLFLYAAKNFISLSAKPVIDGFISDNSSKAILCLTKKLKADGVDYSFDSRNRLQIPLSYLKNHIGKKFELYGLSSNAVAIVPIRPNICYHLRTKFPRLKFYYEVVKQDVNSHHNEDEYDNDKDKDEITKYIYIQDYIISDYSFLKRFGLFLHGVALKFYIPRVLFEGLSKDFKDKQHFGIYQIQDSSFNYKILYNKNIYSDLDEYVTAVKDECLIIRSHLQHFFGRDNVTYKKYFIYRSLNLSYDSRFDGIDENAFSNHVKKLEYFKSDVHIYQVNSNSVVINFDWIKEDLDEIILSIINHCVDFDMLYYHKIFKVNIPTISDITNFDIVKGKISSIFHNVEFSKECNKNTIHFFVECNNSIEKEQVYKVLDGELFTGEIGDNFNVVIPPLNLHQDKFVIQFDKSGYEENLKTKTKSLLGYDFTFGDKFSNSSNSSHNKTVLSLDEKVYAKDREDNLLCDDDFFAKLIKVEYPILTFLVSEDFDEVKNFLSIGECNRLYPYLNGDIEKVYRLKTTLNKIKENKKLLNNNLPRYINPAKYDFDPIPNVDLDISNFLLHDNLNDSQIGAVVKSLLSKDFFIMQGPPGTGKSTVIAEMVWQMIRLNRENERILLTSSTHIAVDNALGKIINENNNLVKPLRLGDVEDISSEGLKFSYNFLKEWANVDDDDLVNVNDSSVNIIYNWMCNIRKRISLRSKSSIKLWNDILKKPTKDIKAIFFKNYVGGCNIIGATCSSVAELNRNGHISNFYAAYGDIFSKSNKQKIKTGITKLSNRLHFTTVIQDEASKATPAELAQPLVFGEKSVVIGDHRQLPPLIDKDEMISTLSTLLKRKDIDSNRRSVIANILIDVKKNFEKFEISQFEKIFKQLPIDYKATLSYQYRMHPDINDIIKQFYVNEGDLKCGLVDPIDLGVNSSDLHNVFSRYHGITIDGVFSCNNHVVWIDSAAPEMIWGTSRVNYGEVSIIDRLLTLFDNSYSFKQFESFWHNEEERQVGIISFYARQIHELQRVVEKFENIPIKLSSVDRFQGMERNIVIVSLVRSRSIVSTKGQIQDFESYPKLGYPEQSSLGFASSPNRLNVALSRARRLLIIIGDSKLFRENTIYDNVYRTIENNPNGIIINSKDL